MKNTLKTIALAALLLTPTACSLEEIVGGDELPKAAEFGTCVVGCYEKAYGKETAPEEIVVE